MLEPVRLSPERSAVVRRICAARVLSIGLCAPDPSWGFPDATVELIDEARSKPASA